MGALNSITNSVSETLGTSGSGGKFLGINTDDLSKTLTTDSSQSGIGALGKELTNNELVNAALVTAAAVYGGPLGAAAANGLISRAQGNDWSQVAANAAGAGMLAYAAPIAYDYATGASAAPLTGPEAGLTEGISYGGGGANAAASAPVQYSANQAVASGMSPGSMGAEMSASNWGATTNSLQSGMGMPGLNAAEAAAAYGTTGPGSALYDIATAGNTAALANQLAEAGNAANLAKMLGGSGGQPSLSQMAINILDVKDQGKNPGGYLDQTLVSTGPAQRESSILKDLPQLAFGHKPTVTALAGGGAVQGYKRGGLAYHQPEFITGATGHYVKGKGDGQSDDIPAMLADGEYVFDADTVAALGNGSSDAGAKRLDEMRQAIRKHKRAAPINKIPPKAKSPLEYLKG
jgi:hypothetical protein